MSFNVYKTKAAMNVSLGSKLKNNNVYKTIQFKFAPFLKQNDSGFGNQYDWQNNKIVFSFSADEILHFSIEIELALKTKDWSKLKVIHKYKELSTKTLSINASENTYFLNVTENEKKITLALSLTELLSLKEYLKFISLDILKTEGEMNYTDINTMNNSSTHQIFQKRQTQNYASPNNIQQQEGNSIDWNSDDDISF